MISCSNVLHTIAHDNDVLVNTVSEFGTLLESSLNSVKPKIFCFYEQKASKIAQRVAGISGVKPVSVTVRLSQLRVSLTTMLGIPCD